MVSLLAVASLQFRTAPQEGPSPSKLIAEERFAEALAALDGLLARDPMDVENGLSRARCLFKLDRFPEAAAAAEALLARAPERLDVRDFRGDCFFMAFKPLEALAMWSPLLDDSRWKPIVMRKSVLALQAAGRDAQARDLLLGREPLGPDSPDGYLLLYARAFDSGPVHLKAVEELARRHPDNAEYLAEATLSRQIGERKIQEIIPPKAYPGRVRILEKYNEPSLEVLLNGRKQAWMTFDTGSQRAMVKVDTYKKLKLQPLGNTLKLGWGYQAGRSWPVVLLDSVRFGDLECRNVLAQVHEKASEFWSNKAGYIGLWPFRDFVVLYDRRGGRLEIWPAGTPPESLLGEGPAVALPILWSSGLPLVPARLQGKGDYPFLLDTGAPTTLLDTASAARFGIRPNSGKYRNRTGLGVSGAFSFSVAEGVTLSFAGWQPPHGFVYLTDVPQRFSVPCYGILGRDFLNRFRMVFDGPAGTVTLVPYP